MCIALLSEVGRIVFQVHGRVVESDDPVTTPDILHYTKINYKNVICAAYKLHKLHTVGVILNPTVCKKIVTDQKINLNFLKFGNFEKDMCKKWRRKYYNESTRSDLIRLIFTGGRQYSGR